MAWLFKKTLQLKPVSSLIFTMWHTYEHYISRSLLSTMMLGFCQDSWKQILSWFWILNISPQKDIDKNGIQFWWFIKNILFMSFWVCFYLCHLFGAWNLRFLWDASCFHNPQSPAFKGFHRVWRLQMHVQSWNVWILLYKDALEISEKNLNQMFVSNKYGTVPMFVKRIKFLEMLVGTWSNFQNPSEQWMD